MPGITRHFRQRPLAGCGSRRRLTIAWVTFGVWAAATGCSVRPPQPVAPQNAIAAPVPETTAAEAVVQGHPIAVVVKKHSRRLELYRRGGLVGTFPVVLGARPDGPKRYEGDLRTPEGVYRVTGKRVHGRWTYFIEIDYPNEADLRAYASEAAAGRIPLFARQLPGVGGRVGIHGNDRPREQASGRDWTKGCIAMRNEDVAVLYDLVDVGTPVVVLP